MAGIVAIIGRPNVGKSTLFNRLVQERKAIVDDMPGVTRDRHYGISEWNGRKFTVIDTGGYVTGSEDVFEKGIREQVHIAMEEADVLVFVVDVTTGINPLDETFAGIVRQTNKPLFLIANKADTHERGIYASEFYSLAIGDPWPVSAINGAGTGDLLDAIVEALPEDTEEPLVADIPKFAIVGRPNVGKSSLVNALLGTEEHLVTDVAGTTRDSIYTRYRGFSHDLYLVDTAGLRRKAKVKENVEFYSTLRSVRAIEECDVALLMIDARTGIEAQDLHILNHIEKNKKGVVILVNKWDLVEKETNTMKMMETDIRKKLEPFSDVPIVFVSVLEKQRILKALEAAVEVFENKNRKISTSELNEVMLPLIAAYHPPAVRGKLIRINYVTQIPATVPTFLFFCNHPKLIKENYKRYLENKIRENWNFSGVVVNIFFRDKRGKKS